jgi:hypothetical protein
VNWFGRGVFRSWIMGELRDVVGTKELCGCVSGGELIARGILLLENEVGTISSRGELELTGGVAKGMEVGIHEVNGLERGCTPAYCLRRSYSFS